MASVAMSSSTWGVEGGRALWNGQSLAYWSKVLAVELAAAFDPVEIWLFGSVARGDDGGDSDLDVLVVLDHYDSTQALALKQQALQATSVPAPFDIAFTDETRMASRRHVVGTIERAVALEGQLLHRRA
jgi:predicted nucleotidyltransferase